MARLVLENTSAETEIIQPRKMSPGSSLMEMGFLNNDQNMNGN